MKLYVRNVSYFIVDQYQKSTCFYAEDAYYYYDVDVDRILLHKESENEYFITYRHSNKMDIVPLQLKIIFFYYDVKDYDGSEDTMYIENSDERVFQKTKEIWNKIIELIGINYAPDFIKYTLDDEKCVWQMADVLENTNFVKSNCYKGEIMIVLHSAVNSSIKASLLKVIENEYC